MRILRRLTGVLSAGYILFYYSEILFWARVRPTDSLPDWIAGWLLYSLMAFIVLSLIARFRVRTLWALFLVGAAFGWLVEGLIVQTLYEELPFSISFTGLAWHALITVWVGWYAVRRALHTGFLPTVLLAAAIGIVYGFWAITWWVEPEGGVSSPLQFAAYTTLSSLLLILACWLHDRTVPISFTPSRVADGVLIALALLYFAFITVPVAPLAAGILPFLLLVIYLPLRRNRRRGDEGSLLDEPEVPPPLRRYPGLLALPLTAVIVYTLAFSLGLRWHTNQVVWLIVTPAGFIVLIVSLIKVWQAELLPESA